MKRILVLGDINSPHIQKWVTSLTQKDFHIGVFSLSKSVTNWHTSLPNLQLFNTHGFEKKTFYQNTFQKALFLRVLPALKSAIKIFNPAILHSHYASSYGLLGALTKFHPYIISVWGSDIFDFPRQNIISKNVLKYNLRKADVIISLSEVMKHETALYTSKPIAMIPWGIDLKKFLPSPSLSSNELVIGTIKTMEEIYGIEYLIKAFKIVKDRNPEVRLNLLLVGGGSQTLKYKKLVSELNLDALVTFTGNVPHDEIAKYHNMIDIYVAVSLRESFGVAILEASACEKPVVVSDVGGLPEVVEKGVTGFIVPSQNETATANAIERLVHDPVLRKTIGRNGRERVKRLYDWENNVEQMISVYNSFQ